MQLACVLVLDFRFILWLVLFVWFFWVMVLAGWNFVGFWKLNRGKCKPGEGGGWG